MDIFHKLDRTQCKKSDSGRSGAVGSDPACDIIQALPEI